MARPTSTAQKANLVRLMEKTGTQIPGSPRHTSNLDKIYAQSLTLSGHPEAKAGMVFISQQAMPFSALENMAAAVLRTWQREEISPVSSGLRRTLARGTEKTALSLGR